MNLTTRLSLTLASLLLGFGLAVGLLARSGVQHHEHQVLQQLSRGLAQHIVEHWPKLAVLGSDAAARDELLQMLMTVNPGIQVYLLDTQGEVQAYLGERERLKRRHVELAPVRAWLSGAALPIYGSDPLGDAEPRLFSAAELPGGQGYLYVVLEGPQRLALEDGLAPRRWWLGAGAIALAALLLTLLLGLLAFRRLVLPLRRLAEAIAAYDLGGARVARTQRRGGDELRSLEQDFGAMRARIDEQAAAREREAAQHREQMASLAHDLRTPLTALHGQLEALLASPAGAAGPWAQAAVAQSQKARRLTQQLFELAMLQSSDQVLQRERVRLDELVADTVHKYSLAQAPVSLGGMAPGQLEVSADLALIDRALSNLIDNAVRHAPGPVQVGLRRQGGKAEVWVEDQGPGLPVELQQRLLAQRPVREGPAWRSAGGLGGLGLAIAQRIAQLHGGSLLPQRTPAGGTRLSLSLPLLG